MAYADHSLSRRFVRISQFFSSLLIAGVSLLGMPAFVHAQSSDASASIADAAGLSSASIFDIIGTLINVFLGLLGVVFLLLVLYAGFLWMTAGGDDGKVEKAKKILINATIGIVITLSSYAITSFIVNWISTGTGFGSRGSGSGGSVAVERLSGSLGSGALRDHYPTRNATDVARNTRIMVTFKEAMDIESFISGYDTSGTPEDTSDDEVATQILSENVSIYRTADGVEAALTNVSVAFSEDLQTFIFDPAEYLGSATESVSYTVFLSPNILSASGNEVFTGANSDGYEWSFETGTTVDTTAPRVVSVVPTASGTYARNIAVQVTFSEAVDPTAATGTRTSSGGFDNIQTAPTSGSPLAGTYEIANGYKTVTFISADACGTNSCGETMYCLPGSENIRVNIAAATPGANPPQVDTFPYDGIVDASANALDGNSDGVAGDDYTWSFSTTGAIELGGPTISSITPNILESNVALDQPVNILFDDVLLANTVASENIAFTNKETTSGTSHEMWYRFESVFLDSSGSEITSESAVPAQTMVSISHGTFLESIEGRMYMYGVTAGNGIRNQYQNCYAPAEGPDSEGGTCSGPYCCNGVASTTACTLF